jgi:cytochrome c biogenesis protein CcmG, thiol:disulfide interchange protein DsbE
MQQITLPLMSSQRIVLQLLVMVVLSAVNNPLVAKARTPVPAAYRSAPNFSRMDLNHGQVNLVDYRGKVVLLNFWATWCAPCLAEMPHYVAWQQEYGGRVLQVIGISMDDEEQPVRIAYRKYRLNYPVVMGDETIGEMYGGILGLPVTFLIDTKGKIRFKHQGAVDLNRLQNEIQTLLPRQ